MKKTKAAVLAWMFLIIAPPLWALSIRTPGKKIVVDKLRTGRRYSLAKKARDPAITNTGQEPIRVRMRVEAPKGPTLEDGYEPASASWLRVKDLIFELKPGEEKALRGQIIVPRMRDPGGGQYQIDWTGVVENKEGSRINFSSRLLLELSDTEMGNVPSSWRARLRKWGLSLFSGKPRRDQSFALEPPKEAAKGVPLGKPVSLRNRDGTSLKIINPTNSREELIVRVERKKPKHLRAREGFTLAPNPHFLRLKRQRTVVRAGQIGIEDLIAEIPDEARYQNRKWFFVLSTRMSGDPTEKEKYALVYLETQAAGPQHRSQRRSGTLSLREQRTQAGPQHRSQNRPGTLSLGEKKTQEVKP